MTASWRTRTLGEVCDQVSGIVQTGPFGSQLHESDYSAAGIPVVMPKDIVEGQITTEDIARVGSEHVERLVRHQLKSGDIVYGRRGDIGRQALVRQDQQGWLCGTGCLRISLGNSVLDPEFLHYYLRQESVISWIANQAIGATLPNLNTSILRSVPVATPPIEIQRRIAGFLCAYDNLIENNRRRIHLLEEIVRTTYLEWFVYLRFPGHEGVAMADSTLGSIPEEWKVKRLGEVADEVRRNVAKGNLDGPSYYVGLEHIPRRSLALDDWAVVEALGSNKLAFQKGDVLFGKIRPYFHKVSVAPFDGLCSADTIVIRALRTEDYATVVSFVASDTFVAHASATANGAKMPRANWEVLAESPILIASTTVARQFSDIVEPIIQLQQTLVQENWNLRATRDLLLPRLMSGRLSLAQAEAGV